MWDAWLPQLDQFIWSTNISYGVIGYFIPLHENNSNSKWQWSVTIPFLAKLRNKSYSWIAFTATLAQILTKKHCQLVNETGQHDPNQTVFQQDSGSVTVSESLNIEKAIIIKGLFYWIFDSI